MGLKAVAWTRNRGRDGWSGSPLQIRPDMSAESRNVTFYKDGLGTKRGGSTAMTESGLTGHNALVEYIPAQDLTAAELFVVDNSATTKILRSTTGTASAPTYANLTLADNVATQPYTFSAVVLNKKLYCAYDSTVNRLHVFDPDYSTTILRRAGMGTPAAPTGADDAAGGLSLSRSYKVAFTEQRSGVTIRRSELSPVLTRTIVAKAGSTITKPASLSEGETHWELYASDTVTGTYYLMATAVVGTTTYDDTASLITTTATAAPTVGSNTPFPSVKSIGTTGSRLYGLGVWESTAGDSMAPKDGRFYFGPVLDSSSTHDDERINNTTTLQGFIDLARNTGAVDRGVTPKPVGNIIFAFQSSGVYGLVPTESDTAPYRRRIYSTSVGNLTQQAIVMGNDRRGAAVAYFLDPTLGPYMVGGADGLKWCGKDVKDVWDTANKDATTLAAWGSWYADRNLLLFGIATGSSNTPDTILALDVTEQFTDDEGDFRGGWSVWTGTFAAAMCALVFSNTFASPRSRVRVPYVGLTAGTTLLRYSESATDDNGTAFQAFVTSGALAAETHVTALQRAYLRASAQTGVTIQQSLIRNAGDETARTSTVSLTPTGSQTTLMKKFEDAALQDADQIQVTLGDASALASAFTLWSWFCELTTGAPF